MGLSFPLERQQDASPLLRHSGNGWETGKAPGGFWKKEALNVRVMEGGAGNREPWTQEFWVRWGASGQLSLLGTRL